MVTEQVPALPSRAVLGWMTRVFIHTSSLENWRREHLPHIVVLDVESKARSSNRTCTCTMQQLKLTGGPTLTILQASIIVS